MKIKKTLLLILILTIHLGFSQNRKVSGTIINTTTKETVPFVTVTLKNNFETKIDVANEEGLFLIENLKNSKYLLKIDAIGYRPFKKTISFDGKNEIRLENLNLIEDIEALDAVVIRAETSSIKQKIDRIVINVGKDLTSIGTDAASVLNNVQSVSVDQQTGELSLRGNSNVRVLIDGKPSNIPTDQLLKQLPANAIKNIELITNPSAKYNPEGNSGIINIELVKNSIIGFNGAVNASLAIGRNIRGRQGFNLNLKKNKVNWYTNYSFGDGNNDIIGRFDRKENTQNTYGFNQFRRHFFKLGVDIDLTQKTSLSLFTVQNFNKLNYTNTTVINTVSDGSITNNSIFDLTRKMKGQAYDASIRRIFDNKKHVLDFGISYRTNTRPESSTTNDTINPYDARNNYIEEISNRTNRVLVNLDYTKPFNDNISLEVGLQYRNLDQSKDNASTQLINTSSGVAITSGLSDFNFNRNIYSAYFNYRHQIDKIGVQIGLRAESYNLDATFFSEAEDQTAPIENNIFSLYPSIFTTYDLTKKDQLQASYSRRVDRPSPRQLTPIRRWGTPLQTSIGNPNLEQQFTNSFELKYNRKLNIGNVSLTGFYRRINKVISRSLSEDKLIKDRLIMSYDNFGTANNYGVELSTYLKPVKWWRFNGSTDAYFRKQNGLVNNKITEIENLQFNIRFNNNFNITKKLSLQVRNMYRGRDKNIQRIREAMFLMSLASSYKVLNDKGTITLGLSDIFNTFRAKFSSKNPIPQEGEFNWESQKVTLGFVYNFGQKFKAKEKRKRGDDTEAGEDVF